MALTPAEQRRAVNLIQRLLDIVDDGTLAADGPKGVALVRHLEGAMLALTGLDKSGSKGQPEPTEPTSHSSFEHGEHLPPDAFGPLPRRVLSHRRRSNESSTGTGYKWHRR